MLQEGQKATVLKEGVEVEMIVFHQSGELVYLFDLANRCYLFPVSAVRSVQNHPSGDVTVHQHSKTC